MEEFLKNLAETDPEAVAAINAAESEEEVLGILARCGMGAESLEELRRELARRQGAAMSDEDLENVAGGGFDFGTICIYKGYGLGSGYYKDKIMCDGVGDNAYCVFIGF